jgi:hypothetical protein
VTHKWRMGDAFLRRFGAGLLVQAAFGIRG